MPTITMAKTMIAAALLILLAGCASTTTQVSGAGSNRGAAGSATLGTGVSF